jgi:hypothetical protein
MKDKKYKTPSFFWFKQIRTDQAALKHIIEQRKIASKSRRRELQNTYNLTY